MTNLKRYRWDVVIEHLGYWNDNDEKMLEEAQEYVKRTLLFGIENRLKSIELKKYNKLVEKLEDDGTIPPRLYPTEGNCVKDSLIQARAIKKASWKYKWTTPLWKFTEEELDGSCSIEVAAENYKKRHER